MLLVSVLLLVMVMVMVVTAEPVHQLLDGEHEEEADAHDELGEQPGHGQAGVERAVVGQPLHALPDLGQQVQERGAQQHAAAKVQDQPEHGVGGAASPAPDAQPLEHAHGRAADHERRNAQERHGQHFGQHRVVRVHVVHRSDTRGGRDDDYCRPYTQVPQIDR